MVVQPPVFVATPPVFDLVTAAGIGGLAVLMAGVVLGLRVRYEKVSPWPTAAVLALCVIAWVARSSSPVVRAFADDPRHLNTWVLYFPYVWLPTVLVMITLSGHLVLTRRLLRER